MVARSGLEKARVTLEDLPPLSIFYKNRSTVTHKNITSNIATLTINNINLFKIGQGIVVSNVGSPFDGYHVVTAITTNSISFALSNGDVDSAVTPNGLVVHTTKGYRTRYRVVSTDRNRYSHWSSVQEVIPPLTFSRPSGIALDGIKSFITNTGGNNKVITFAWDPIDVFNDGVYFRKAVAYDVWIRWNTGSWEFKERVSSTSLTIARPASNPTTLSIEIYGRTPDISRDAGHQQMLFYKRDNIAL